jgi:nitrite reductase/ring-hydroxylating ferredoxin subunit
MSAVTSDNWHDLGAADTIEEGEAQGFTIGEKRICVIRHEGGFHALADLCTHGHAFLSDGFCDTDEGVIECPLHGGLFDFRTGQPVGAPVTKAVATYAVTVAEGRLLVQVTED